MSKDLDNGVICIEPFEDEIEINSPEFKIEEIQTIQKAIIPLLENLNIATHLEVILSMMKEIDFNSDYLITYEKIKDDLSKAIEYFQSVNKPTLKEIIDVFYSRGQECSNNMIPSKIALTQKIISLIHDYNVEVQLSTLFEEWNSLILVNEKIRLSHKERIECNLSQIIDKLKKQYSFFNGKGITISF